AFSCPVCKMPLPDYALSCENCGAELRGVELRTPQMLDNSVNRKENSIFFYVSPFKLVLMTICSFGCYQLFWFYKNWTYAEEHTNKVQKPMVNAIFAVLTFYGLIKEISRAGGQAGIFKKLPAAFLAILFAAMLFVGRFEGMLYLVGLWSCLCLVPVQQYVN